MHIWQDLMMIWDRKGAAEAFENHGANALHFRTYPEPKPCPLQKKTL